MKGTASKDAQDLYVGILDYYANLSGMDITAEQIARRDQFKDANGIICDDSLDAKVLAVQDRFVGEDDPSKKRDHIVEAIALLS